MPNLLSRFNKLSIGSNDKISDYIPRIYASGDFQRVEELNVILTSWNNILMTPKRTYTWDPEYGSNLYKLIFEPINDFTAGKIRNETIGSITRYDSRAQIDNVEVSFLSQYKGFSIDIFVDYKESNGRLSATIDENLYFNFLRVSS